MLLCTKYLSFGETENAFFWRVSVFQIEIYSSRSTLQQQQWKFMTAVWVIIYYCKNRNAIPSSSCLTVFKQISWHWNILLWPPTALGLECRVIFTLALFRSALRSFGHERGSLGSMWRLETGDWDCAEEVVSVQLSANSGAVCLWRESSTNSNRPNCGVFNTCLS